MTPYTVVRELFCCGSGKGGVMQNQGKENEYIPKLMPTIEGNNEKLDCVTAASAGRHHVAILCFEDLLTNVEAANKEVADMHDQVAVQVRELDTLEKEVQEFQEEDKNQVEVQDEEINPFDYDRLSLCMCICTCTCTCVRVYVYVRVHVKYLDICEDPLSSRYFSKSFM